MARFRTNRNGKSLNPHYTAKRYAKQLKQKGVKDANGNLKPLSKSQAAFRMGYLTAQSDSAATYKKKFQ